MEKITTIGFDLAKSLFQVHAVTGEGKVALRRSLRRSQVLDFFRSIEPCLIGIEACGTAHYWANAIQQFGHTVRLMPPAYVKAYVKLCSPRHNFTYGLTYCGGMSFTSCPNDCSNLAQ